MTRMKPISKSLLALLIALVLGSAHAGEAQQVLNLRELDAQGITVSGNQMFLVLTGQPPPIFALTNQASSPLKRGAAESSKSLRVTYGKDLIGFARPTVTFRSPKEAIMCVTLVFENAEQAVAAGKAVKPRHLIPLPPRIRTDEK